MFAFRRESAAIGLLKHRRMGSETLKVWVVGLLGPVAGQLMCAGIAIKPDIRMAIGHRKAKAEIVAVK